MLVRIPYFGKKGVEKYGDTILEIVYAYCKEKGLAEPEACFSMVEPLYLIISVCDVYG